MVAIATTMVNVTSPEARKALDDIGKDALKPRRSFEKDEVFVGNSNSEERVYKSAKDYVENTPWVTDMLNEFAGYGNVKDIVYLEPQYRDGKRLPVISVSDGERNYVFLVDKDKGALYPENYAARSRYRDVMARLSERRSREEEQQERSRAMSSDRGLRLGLPSVDEVRRIAGGNPSYR